MTRRSSPVIFLDQSGELGGAELSLLDIVSRRPVPATVCLFSKGLLLEALEGVGAETHVLEISKELALRRHDGLFSLLRATPHGIKFVWRLAKLLRGFDVIYANTIKAFVFAAIASPLHRRPILWHLHDLLTEEHFSPPIRKLIVTFANMSAHTVIANSHAVAEAFKENGGTANPIVIYNGISYDSFEGLDPVQERQRLVDATGLDPAKPIVGVFSRLAEWKGQHILLEAMTDLPDMQAVIVGGALFHEEAYERRLKAYVKDNKLESRVAFLGFRKDVASLMKAVDIVAHTSISAEPFGRVIIEGMLARKPVLASSAGGVGEIIRDFENGLLVTPAQPQALIDALSFLLKNPEKANLIATSAFDDVRKRFSLEAYSKQISDVIDDVARTQKI